VRFFNVFAGRFDSADGGSHSTPLAQTTLLTETGTPVRRRVRLHDQTTGRVVREMWSDPVTGDYQFVGLRAGTYYITAFDHTGAYNGEVITDVVLPAP
jgi:uncharacterized surface anchored protein